MITCLRFDNCVRIGIVPERVTRGYGPCRNKGTIPRGEREGEKYSFVTFAEIDIEKANQDILEGKTRAHEIARGRLADY